MNKVAHYLQEHVVGEVYASPDVRQHFSEDASVFSLPPAIVVYPRSENDVRKSARFCWQLAERGRFIPITARGSGTDLSGAAIGSGILLIFPAHMHKILELDPKTGVVAVQPGTNYGKLQQTLHTHGRFLPPFPASLQYSTIGGAVANNAGGSKSYKYGVTRDYVRSLRVVLANGELIETGRLSKRELSRKMGLTSFEGQLYRELDKLIEENKDTVNALAINVSKSNAGYAIAEVKYRDGSLDLTPLLVGSQGTLGLITEIILDTESYNPEPSLVMAGFETVDAALEALEELKKMHEMPSEIDFIDHNLLDFVSRNNPHVLKGYFADKKPAMVLFAEFDNENTRHQKKLVKKFHKIAEKYGEVIDESQAEEHIERIRAVRDAAAGVLTYSDSSARAVPIIDDAVVPTNQLKALFEGIDEMMRRNGLDRYAIWGHGGDGNVHLAPFLDLAQVGDRQKVFKLLDEYYTLVTKLGGSISGEHGDGRLRGPLLHMQFEPAVMELSRKIKKVFDPYNTLNPGVKFDATIEASKTLLKTDYSVKRFADHLPRS